jgi:hypothetical protein
MYYLEELKILDIVFLDKLLNDYHKDNYDEKRPDIKLDRGYYSLKSKVCRLKRFVIHNPYEQDTPKQESKFSKLREKKNSN